jgi:hypothetical protein
MQGVPEWLREAGDEFAGLPVERQRAVVRRIAEELRERTARLRDRVREADLPAFDAAAEGIVARARELADFLQPGSVPQGAAVLVGLALDNRGVSLLEPIALRAVRDGVRGVGLGG